MSDIKVVIDIKSGDFTAKFDKERQVFELVFNTSGSGVVETVSLEIHADDIREMEAHLDPKPIMDKGFIN